MRYSCFDEPRGLYRLFEDGAQHPVNADLPVPTFAVNNRRVGAPATHAARPLPASARPAGWSWRPEGIVVRCGSSGLSGVSFDAGTELAVLLGAALVVFIVAVKVFSPPSSGFLHGQETATRRLGSRDR